MSACRGAMMRFFACCVLMLAAGCALVPKSRYDDANARSKTLLQENAALLAKLDNVEAHARQQQQEVIDLEAQLAKVERRANLAGQQLSNVRLMSDRLQQLGSGGPDDAPSNLSARVENLSRKYSPLRFDPATGLARLDHELLFETGEAEMRPESERALAEFASVLSAPENRQFKVFVAGHADDRRIKGRDIREKYPTNWDLSAARSLEVVKALSRHGIGDDRLALGGFGEHQPVVRNVDDESRQQNRRVEIFVVAPDRQLVGWTETIPTVYR